MLLDEFRQFRRRFDRRVATVMAHDTVMAAVAFEVAIAVAYQRLDHPVGPFEFWQGTLGFAAISLAVFFLTGLYRGLWHFASWRDLAAIARAVSLAILVFLPVAFVATRLADLPRSALLLLWPILVVLLAGPRLLYRAYKDGNLRLVFDRRSGERVPILLLGTDAGAAAFIAALDRRRVASWRIVGLIDPRARDIGRDIHGVRILGGLDDLGRVVAQLAARGVRPEKLVITTPLVRGAEARRLLDQADRLGLALARSPAPTELQGRDGAAEIRPIDVEDLLGRPRRELDRAAMQALIAGRRVLVTGAGGTIGSELCRQISGLGPAGLALVDNGEYNLYAIDLELAEAAPALPRRAHLADVRDRARLAGIFQVERPELVFHAAAFKHVPLVEDNPAEGTLSNVLGTRNVADLAQEIGAAAMVLISTDKAVAPASVMGASKRVAELYCQALDIKAAAKGGTRFVVVRFGNVLGSAGSVVPLFQRQLARGGPLTVTDPEATRFFMTTGEAVELTLLASALGPQSEARGKIFVLDMGEPVRIADLARQMIRLAGKVPEREIGIVYTGLRPGEKLHETLEDQDEPMSRTKVEGILLAAPRVIEHALLTPLIEQLTVAARAGLAEETKGLLHRIVPGYTAPVGDARAAGSQS
ncbi:polysaccharide biosynthesis protein [Desertibaculum subflavum]|uniref:polysaccharide biosynthesis protein n=1 Tax=Desertibaculum subflavum TaxID=2268458 RepID=UPI0034D27EC5